MWSENDINRLKELINDMDNIDFDNKYFYETFYFETIRFMNGKKNRRFSFYYKLILNHQYILWKLIENDLFNKYCEVDRYKIKKKIHGIYKLLNHILENIGSKQLMIDNVIRLIELGVQEVCLFPEDWKEEQDFWIREDLDERLFRGYWTDGLKEYIEVPEASVLRYIMKVQKHNYVISYGIIDSKVSIDVDLNRLDFDINTLPQSSRDLYFYCRNANGIKTNVHETVCDKFLLKN